LRDWCLADVGAFCGGVEVLRAPLRQVFQEKGEGDLGLAQDEVVYPFEFVVSGGKQWSAGNCFDTEFPAPGDNIPG